MLGINPVSGVVPWQLEPAAAPLREVLHWGQGSFALPSFRKEAHMIQITGKYNTAVCYTGQLESIAAEQIRAVCDRAEFADCKIRIMPDVHAGMGCTIGTTMTITDKVVPGMVGVDIGCGMETVMLAQQDMDLAALDHVIRENIPCGREIRDDMDVALDDSFRIDLSQLRCSPYVNLERARLSIGTLGGGNHFIEVDRGEDGNLYLVIHSGSRHIGFEVANYYQEEGRKALWGGARYQVDAAVAELKAQGRFREIQPTIDRLRREHAIDIPKELAYVEGRLFEDYIHDMKMIQYFALLNRRAMVDIILAGMGLTPVEAFTTIHNYIDTEHNILRKGAVAAYKGQKLLIPINMRDGSLICLGKGNPDWNCSAPHGAGRIMSRKDAFRRLSLEEYRSQMAGIYTTCVDSDTLDEAPMAYKGLEDILSNIGPTAEVLQRIRPIYNFKAAE